MMSDDGSERVNERSLGASILQSEKMAVLAVLAVAAHRHILPRRAQPKKRPRKYNTQNRQECNVRA
jgi:heme exporter protein D